MLILWLVLKVDELQHALQKGEKEKEEIKEYAESLGRKELPICIQ